MKIFSKEHADSAKFKELRLRIMTALWGIPLLVSILTFGGIPLELLVLILAFGAAWEYQSLVREKGGNPSALGLFGGFLLLFCTQRANFSSQIAVTILVLANLSLAAVRYSKGSPLINAGYGISGALYVGMFNYLILLQQLEAPSWSNFALYGLFLTWATDIGAYFFGSKWGKTPLAPKLSPNKSWEGALAGAVGCGIVASLLGSIWFGWTSLAGALVGLLVSLAAQLGDLTESALKRDAKVKDTGQILPGHGGVLDRFDSLLFVAPVLYYTIGIFF